MKKRFISLLKYSAVFFIGVIVGYIFHSYSAFSRFWGQGRGKAFIKYPKVTEFLPGIPIRKDEIDTKYSEEQNRLFGRAFESYLTGKYDQALILSRRLYKSTPDDKKTKELYYKSLEKLVIVHEEKQDYRTALDYIEEAEKIKKGQHLKEIKKRILAKTSNELLEKKRDVN